jgi:cytochrome c556
MWNCRWVRSTAGLLLGAGLVTLPVLYAADLPKLAEVVAASDLAGAANDLLTSIEPKVADTTALKEAGDEVEHKAYVLALIANGIGRAQGDAAWKKNAGQVREVALKLAKTKSAPEASKLVAEMRSLMAGGGSGAADSEKPWADVSPLKHVMKEVQELRRPISKNTRGAGLKSKKDVVARDAALWAFLGYVARHDTGAAKQAKKSQADYEKFADEFIAGSRALSEAARKGDADAVKKAVSRASKACTDCHEVFRPDVTDDF